VHMRNMYTSIFIAQVCARSLHFLIAASLF
jgi:hypothetical protein